MAKVSKPPKNPSLNQATQENPGIKNLKLQKSFRHPRHLKSRVPPHPSAGAAIDPIYKYVLTTSLF